MDKGVDCFTFDLLSEEPGIFHCVTMKDSSAPLEFSLALHTGEDKSSALSNRALLADFFGRECSFAGVRQVHGNNIYIVENGSETDWLIRDGSSEADALLTDREGVVLNILTADCVPLLLYDPRKRVIGAVHAGWRGCRENIAGLVIEKMAGRYGSDPSDILAAIGPSIGQCCYEVDYDTAGHFFSYPDSVEESGGQKYMLDLKRINELQLMDAGVMQKHIETSSACTSCKNDRFFSYRREEGCSGRFASSIMLTWS